MGGAVIRALPFWHGFPAALTLGMSIRHATGLSVAAALARILVCFEGVNPVVLLVAVGTARAALQYVRP